MDPTICTFLAPMRNGSTILATSLFKHPDILGINGLIEQTVSNPSAGHIKDKAKHLVSMYPALLQSIASHRALLQKKTGKQYMETETMRVFQDQFKVLIDRNHVPMHRKLVTVLRKTNFKILIILRDPREVILSFKKWKKKNLLGVGQDDDHFIELGIKKWKEAVYCWENLKDSNDVFLIKHEDICDNPYLYGKRLFDWLGVEFNEDQLNQFTESYEEVKIKRDEDRSYLNFITPDLAKLARVVGYEINGLS